MDQASRQADSAPTPQPRFAALDGLRGLAIIMVTVYHIWSNAGAPDLGPVVTPLLGTGYLGVTWFFVISGFLLTYPLAQGSKPQHRWRSFAARRAARILPPFYLACAVWVVMPLLAYGRWIGTDPLVILSHFTLTYSLFPDFYRELSPAGYWFVGTLCHLYLLFPLLLLAAGRRLWAFAALTLAVSLVTRTWSFAPTSPLVRDPALAGHADVLQASALGHLAEFSAGIVVAYLAVRWRTQGRRIRSGALVSALSLAGLLAYPYLAFPARGAGLIPTYPAAGVVYAAVLFVLVVHGGFLASLLSWRPLRWVGAISYSMYLYNFFPFVFFSGRLPGLPAQWPLYWALAFATVVIVGAISYALTERPFVWLRRLRAASAS